jgi:hypothetical protein
MHMTAIQLATQAQKSQAHELHSEVDIEASAESVWKLLTDLASYAQWNPFVRRAAGEAQVGSQLDVYLQPDDGRGMRLRPIVLVAEPMHELRWRGKLFISGLFDGEHSFTIVPLGPDRVRLVQHEVFTGLLVPVLWNGLKDSTLRGFRAMNQALKEQAERP